LEQETAEPVAISICVLEALWMTARLADLFTFWVVTVCLGGEGMLLLWLAAAVLEALWIFAAVRVPNLPAEL